MHVSCGGGVHVSRGGGVHVSRCHMGGVGVRVHNAVITHMCYVAEKSLLFRVLVIGFSHKATPHVKLWSMVYWLVQLTF